MNRRSFILYLSNAAILWSVTTPIFAKNRKDDETKEYIKKQFNNKKLSYRKNISIYNGINIKKKKYFDYCENYKGKYRININANMKNVISISLFFDTPTNKMISKFNLSKNTIPNIGLDLSPSESTRLIVVVEKENTLYFNSVNLKPNILCCYGG